MTADVQPSPKCRHPGRAQRDPGSTTRRALNARDTQGPRSYPRRGKMSFVTSRRAFVAGAAALTFVRIPGARAATPGVLTFGLSSFPPTNEPFATTGTAAGTPKLMNSRGFLVTWERAA